MTLQVFYLNNGSSDTPVDYSGQGSDGTKSGTITSSSTSVFYDGLIQILFGSGAYIDSGHTFSHDNDFTLVFYGSAMSQTNTYLYSADQFDLQFDGSNQMVFTMTNDAAGTQTITTSGGINKNSGVIMVIASWDVSTKEMTLYIDDSKQTATASGAFTTSDTNARIGADTAGANNYSSLMSVFMGFDTYITNDMATKLFAVCNRKRIYIKCSDTSATVDDSGYDVGLTLSNITGGGSIVTGKSYVFNGTSSYITIDALDSLDTFRDFSFQCWVNFDTKVTDQFLVDMGYQQNGGFGVYYDTSVDQLKAVMTNMAGTDTEVNILSVVKTGVWYFISVTWDWSSKTLSTYIDAKIINQTTCSGEYAFLNYSVDVEIGRQSGGSAYFDGNLVEIRLENNLFNSTDINDYYHLRGNGNYYSKIHTDFKFSGDYLDSSGLNNHLTASGGNSYDFTRSNVRSGQGLEINSKTDYLEVTNYKYRFFEKDIIAFSFTGYDLYDSGGTIGGTVFGDAYIGGDYTGRFHFRNSTNSSVAIYGSAFFTEDTLGSTFGFISYNLNSTNIRFVYAEVDFINNSGEVWVDNTSIGTFNFNKNVAVPYEERDFRIGYLESNERGLLRGTLDRLTIYSQPLTSSQRKEAYQYSEYYDLRIKNRSVFWRITSMSFTNSINFQSGDFDAVLYNKYLEFDDLLERGSDVKIYQDGVLVWFGSLEEPLFGKNRMIRLIGRHYFNILFQRRASIDYSGSAASRASIMGTLITNKLSSAQGKIHFNNSGVQTINSNTITPVITEEFVGNIFLRFAKQENAVVFLEMDSSYADGSSAIPINYIPKGFESSGVQFDHDNHLNSLPSTVHLRGWSFSRDAKGITTAYTVYSPATTAESTTLVSVEDEYRYGKRDGVPVPAVDALTQAQRLDIGDELIEDAGEVITGTIIAKDYYALQAGKSLVFTASDQGYDQASLLIYESTHQYPGGVEMKVVDLTGGQSDAIVAVNRRTTEINLRDADVVNSTNTIFYRMNFEFEVRFYISCIDGNGVERLSETTMITTRAGKEAFAKMIAGESVNQLDATYSYITYGTSTTVLDDSATAMGTETGTRKVADAAPSITGNGIRTWAFTITDTEVSATTDVTELGICNASSGATVVGVANCNTITKVTSVDLNFVVKMEVI